MANGFSLAFVGLCFLIIATQSWNQAFIQTGPFCFTCNRVPCYQIHHLLHLTGTSFRETCPVKGDSCLCSLGCPSEVSLEMACIFKVRNMTNLGEDTGSIHGANRRV